MALFSKFVFPKKLLSEFCFAIQLYNFEKKFSISNFYFEIWKHLDQTQSITLGQR